MSYLLFMDESGQDHKQMPYEVRGGIAMPAQNVWHFSRDLNRKEEELFGVRLADFGVEIKGDTLLKKDILKWANYEDSKKGKPYEFKSEDCRGLVKEFLKRNKNAREFLKQQQSELAADRRKLQNEIKNNALTFSALDINKVNRRTKQDIEKEIALHEREVTLLHKEMALSHDNKNLLDPVIHTPGRLHYAAYGQACCELVLSILDLLARYNACLFASMVPSTAFSQSNNQEEFLRRDINYLLERFYYLLEEQKTTGVIVMDQTELKNDRAFGELIANYFGKTQKGKERVQRIVPLPLFITQDISQLLGAADLCLYILNWGYRIPGKSMEKMTRPDMLPFVTKTVAIQWKRKIPQPNGSNYGIFYEENIYG